MADVRISEVRKNLKEWEEWIARIKQAIESQPDGATITSDALEQLRGAPDRPHVSPCNDPGSQV